MSTGIIEIIKMAAMDVIENSNPCDLRFGTVSSISPLKVKVTNDFIIPEQLLVVPEHLTNHDLYTNVGGSNESGTGSINMSVQGETLFITTGGTEVVDDESTEIIEPVDNRTLTIYNSLEVGDKVILLRNQGGSSYVILDRI